VIDNEVPIRIGCSAAAHGPNNPMTKTEASHTTETSALFMDGLLHAARTGVECAPLIADE
jgi:hypothetical protein